MNLKPQTLDPKPKTQKRKPKPIKLETEMRNGGEAHTFWRNQAPGGLLYTAVG